MTRLSVVIPTLNEAEALPLLLEALADQTRPPDEIIVADAGSQDETVALALARGVQVVRGGRPGVGRNAGARAATGDILLFLDADVLPGADFIKRALDEFEGTGYVVATCRLAPLGDRPSDQILADLTNGYLQVVQYVSPHAPGFCIFCRRRIHTAIGGFNETVKLAEDHDYVQRAARHGPFGILKSVSIPVSMRRVEKEGLARLALKYLWCETYALAGKPIYTTPFAYEFGAHRPPPAETARLRWIPQHASLVFAAAPLRHWKIVDRQWLVEQAVDRARWCKGTVLLAKAQAERAHREALDGMTHLNKKV